MNEYSEPQPDMPDKEPPQPASAAAPAAERRRPFQFGLRAVFIAMTVFALLLGLVIGCLDHILGSFHGFFSGRPGPVTSPADWPRALRTLVGDASTDDVEVQLFQVHAMCRGWEQEYIWSMPATPGLVEWLEARWRLSPMAPPQDGIFCGRSINSGDRTPPWWSPKANSETRFYECSNSVKREGVDRFKIAIDESRGIIFVHYHEMW